jgi:hypothetical protein
MDSFQTGELPAIATWEPIAACYTNSDVIKLPRQRDSHHTKPATNIKVTSIPTIVYDRKNAVNSLTQS